MGETTPNQPFLSLGKELKQAREARKQTLAEVSGAVEIDIDMLQDIEQGSRRPSEDILLLLINFFDLEDTESTKLWELAGYTDGKQKDSSSVHAMGFDLGQPVAMVMPMDLRVIYTDSVQITTNDYGVVLNFMQSAGPNGQPLAVSRVGMSKEHANKIVQVLSQALTTTNKPIKALQKGNKPQEKS
ncbi:MAG TPA: helix-turn-helix domain-containing protein [Candidatus Saccharibacteria bacterium]|nr:helix-turn-helix domain-containing protein [Candidatus Saccharibacteria bacterium]